MSKFGGSINSVILAGLLLQAAAPLSAQEPALPRSGERLSTWILRQPTDAGRYLPGLSWQVPLEQQSQARLKHYLLGQLAVSPDIKATATVRERLAQWIKTLPVTGRVALPMTDPRWLQGHPDKDPVLEYGQRVILPSRPSTVTVITEDARRCTVPHRAGAEALAYLSACEPDKAGRIDKAWVIQPDGNVRAFKIARWNAEAQDQPAPGARIWAPSRDAGWTPRFSVLLAEFLATQNSAEDVPAVHGLPAVFAEAPAAEMPPARSGAVTANDWGLIGLLQTPTARMAETGDMRFSFSRVYPYGRGSVIFQPLDWLEAGFRYTNISNRLYGREIAGDQAYKDKSLDFKLRLAEETATRPQLALGMTDIGGTGLFSSEYLVASKRSGNFDWSLGIGWGYLGGSNNFGNPLSILGKGFDHRQTNTSSSGGTVSAGSFFHGNTALFGGVQYQTPWDNVLLKAEYDGNDYRHEPQANHHKQGSAVNLGAVYRYSPSVDLTAGIERGNTFMIGLTLHGGLDKITVPKVLDPPRPKITAQRPTHEPDWSRTAADLSGQTHWPVTQISRDGRQIRVVFEEAYGTYWKDRIDRAAAILHRDAPADIDRFVLVFAEHGVPMTERIILRDAWLDRTQRYQAMAERFEAIAAAEPRPPMTSSSTLWASDKSPFAVGLAPNFQQSIGGPDGFILFQAGVAAPMELKLADHTWLSGKANFRVADNYDKFKYDAPSNLPRVRTYMREYLTTARVTLPNLQLTHLGRLNHNQYYSAYAGYLESMFAGIGAEWLYRPSQSPLAFGIDANRVRQRDFRQDFALRDYAVNTGHATLYWDTGWNSTHVNLSAGQYLAGDRGVTMDVSRTFRNGVTLGAWATKTNVSAAKFGEGSFDKGVYVSIPFDAMLPFSSPAIGTFVWTPLTRDGGAKLGRGNTLYGMTGARDRRLSTYVPADPSLGISPDDGLPLWGEDRSLFGDLGSSVGQLGHQLTAGDSSRALLLGGGLVAASALFDRPLASWAKNHQSPRWNSLGKAANSMPFLLATGTGVLWWGAAGENASDTAWTAIKSAALTLAVETAAKYAVGRARPDQNLGATHFDPFGKGAANSSFPSIHMGASFALVAPFAQEYDAPWLYALAGATAFGRIQQRQHFASDVVAGSLIGYSVGSLLLDQQRQRKTMPRISIDSDRRIIATWDFN